LETIWADAIFKEEDVEQEAAEVDKSLSLHVMTQRHDEYGNFTTRMFLTSSTI